MRIKRIILTIIICLLLLPLNVFAVDYAKVGASGDFNGNINIPSGSAYYINGVAVKLSNFAATTSAELAGVISDETGTDKLVYNTSPVLVTPTLGAASATSIDLTGGQIAFPASQSASAGANTLDDYEEGTWTIGVSFGGGTTGITYDASYVSGIYTKIGRLVSVTGHLVLTSKGSSTGTAQITGLPFTNDTANGADAVCTVKPDYITFANMIIGYIPANTSSIQLWECTEAGAATQLTNADFANNSQLIVSMIYQAQ